MEKEILKQIPHGNLREWAKVNGYDLEAFDQLEKAWQEANAEPATPVIPNT